MNKKWSFLLLFVFILSRDRVKHAEKALRYLHDALSIPYHPLQNEDDLDPLIKEIGDAKIVLLGESTHGTHEFYDWRTAITRRLIKEKGFDLIAIEGDWVDSYRVNQFIKGPLQDSLAVISLLRQYDRWPSWMWANQEMVSLIRWLNYYNKQHQNKKISFYGLDLYSFWEWTEEELPVNDKVLRSARQKLKDFFAPYDNDAMKYARAIREGKPDGSAFTEDFRKKFRDLYGNKPPVAEADFLVRENSFLALDGEKYFRVSTRNRVQAINLRDGHMAACINRILQFHGPAAKIIVWVHNGHAGNIHYSDASSAGYTNLGEILKNQWGKKKTFSVGFGTYKGFVTAAYNWNGDFHQQVVLPAKTGSWEALLHAVNNENKLILSKELDADDLPGKWIETRSIGVTYSGAAIYNKSIIGKRFDAFIFIDSTTATRPLE